MKRILPILLLLLCPLAANANSCVAAGTGNWRAISWTTCGSTFPSTTDTAAIGGSFVVTIPVGETETTGNNPASSGDGTTVSGTAQLIINGTLDSQGNLRQTAQGNTVQINGGGTLILDAPAGNRYDWVGNGTGASFNNFIVAGTGWGAGQFGTVNGDGGRGGTFGRVIPANSGSILYGIPSFTYALFKNLGDASNQAYLDYEFISTTTDVMHNVVWLNSGFVEVDVNSANLDWNAVDFRSPTASYACKVVNEQGGSVGTRSMKNITIYNPTASSTKICQIDFARMQIDTWITYNSRFEFLVGQIVGKTFNHMFMMDDANSNGVDFMTPANGAANAFQNSIYLTHVDNPHYFPEQAPGTVVGPNIIQDNVFDGDGFFGSDAGDLVQPTNGSVVFRRNLNINKAGTLFTMGSTGSRITASNNTSFGSYGGTTGETLGGAGQLVYTYNNLFVSGASSSFKDDGFNQGNAFASQSGWAMDYTGWWNLSGSNITHPILGGASYLGPASTAAWFASGAFGNDKKGLHDVTGNPNFVDSTRTVRGCGGWASVLAAAKEMVTINGIDFNGASTTATIQTVDSILSCVRVGFVPTNSIYKGTGLGGVDIGFTGVMGPGGGGKVGFGGKAGF